jgi:hypothetical protein
MPDQKHDVKSASASRQILLAADKDELVGIIETLQADLQKRMEVEEEILHLNLQRGTASLQSQVEEASRRFKVAQQELEAFRLEILNEEGDPAGQAPRPYIYEDLSAPPQEGPDRNTLRSLLASFRRLRDDRDRLKGEVERAAADKVDASRLRAAVGELEAAGTRLKQELDAARAELQRLRDEISREKAAPVVPSEELQALRNEVIQLQQERSLLWRERDDVRAEAERLRQGLPPAPSGTAPEELLVLRNEVSRLEAEQASLRRERDEARAEAEERRDETPPPAPVAAPEELTALKSEIAELEAERDSLEQMNRNSRAEVEKLYAELDEVRDSQSRALEEAGALRSAKSGLEDEIGRIVQENERLQGQSAKHVEEQAELGRRLAYEQAKTEQLAADGRGLVARLAETGRKLEEARFELDNPRQTAGFENLEKFLDKAKLLPLLEKSVRGPRRKDQYSAAEMLHEFIGAVIGAQDHPLEAARNLTPRIHRPTRSPSLGELRQFVEGLNAAELAGALEAHDALRASFFPTAKRTDALTVDLDTLELVVDQRPRPPLSYWPIVLYVPELQEFWHGMLRTAPDDSPKALVEFLSEGFSRMPSALEKGRVRLRADARFHHDAVLRLLESKKCSYVIPAPDSPELRTAARSCAYAPMADGWEAGEWVLKGRSSASPEVRTVALRHARSAQPQPVVPFTFRDPHHVYHAFAVDRKITAAEALASYAAREMAEEREHALLKDFSLNCMKARGPEAHATVLPLFLLAADLLQWYRRSMK